MTHSISSLAGNLIMGACYHCYEAARFVESPAGADKIFIFDTIGRPSFSSCAGSVCGGGRQRTWSDAHAITSGSDQESL
jgi:hypothetical protein